ncbi:hypothetical protein C0991_007214 [Blastosporella zonata]|nr:hypothetical protein C0991_007214 [Blastosporella zonata]
MFGIARSFCVQQDWTATYQALLTFTLLNASGPASYQPPQIFYVKLSMSFNVSLEVKARSALRVEDAELLALEEFRRATVNKSHRLYSEENGQLLDGFNQHMNARSRIGFCERLAMVVQRLEVHHEGVPMTYFKSWFHETDSATNLNLRLRDGAWLPYLKEKVAAGNGWAFDLTST